MEKSAVAINQEAMMKRKHVDHMKSHLRSDLFNLLISKLGTPVDKLTEDILELFTPTLQLLVECELDPVIQKILYAKRARTAGPDFDRDMARLLGGEVIEGITRDRLKTAFQEHNDAFKRGPDEK